ncbi:MAG: tRNA pseudouridine synthase B [marine bacterium B5-7]|nr:MAG: tRNA pseudouridine synthase B [marine bacterium B5-7]
MAHLRRFRGRDVHGILLLDKPLGLSSNEALQEAKRIVNARKAGHTGSLDPLATGMLPICFGEATKFSQFLLDADKCYYTEMQLGIKTTTGDAEGETVEQKSFEGIDKAKLQQVMEKFRGHSKQVPSMYSALKYEGQPLYKLAREGIEVEREPRDIHVYEIELLDFDAASGIAAVRIHCSKGTYIRTLTEDIGEQLGCGAHVAALRRESVGPFEMDDMISLETLAEAKDFNMTGADGYLKPIQTCIDAYPKIKLTAENTQALQFGQVVQLDRVIEPGMIQLYAPDDTFIGIGEVSEDNELTSKRLVSERHVKRSISDENY